MAMMMKYRVHEVAKDFGTTSKVITQILTDYATTPKNHMQVLEIPELDVIFEYMTQHNQVDSLEDVFKVTPPEKKPEPQEETKAEEKAAASGAAEAKGGAKAQPAGKGGQQKPAAPQQSAPAQQGQQNAQAQKKKENKPHVPRQVAEKRVVDTRGGAAVNIEKYNEKFEDMAGNKANSQRRRLSPRPSSVSRRSSSPPPSADRRSATVRTVCSVRSQRKSPWWSRFLTRSPWASWPPA